MDYHKIAGLFISIAAEVPLMGMTAAFFYFNVDEGSAEMLYCCIFCFSK